MDHKLAAALARRLAAYSATAGVVLAVGPRVDAQGAPTEYDPDRALSDSQVIYYDLDPDLVLRSPRIGTSSANMDFDFDGGNDLRMFACYNYASCYQRGGSYRVGFSLPPGAAAQNGVLGYGAGWVAAATRLSSGDPVGPPATGQGFYTYAVAAFNGYSGAGFPFVGQRGFAGFRFVAGDGQLRYGWIRIGVNQDVTRVRAFEFAYEATPETPIAAGDRGVHAPAVTLDATVNQTVLPPEGGTLTFTATLTNTTDAPEDLHLWAVARTPNGRLVGVRRLGAVTVPPGATVTGEVSARVPAAAPSGTAEVKLHVGRYPAVVDSEAFTITKEPGARAAEVEGEDVFFAGEAASAAAAAPLETHSLSAPHPNPAPGRTALTLSVAEAQHVSVAVHDALGRRVALLHDGPLVAGEAHRLVFDGSALPAGVYVVRAVGAAFADTRVLTLTR